MINWRKSELVSFQSQEQYRYTCNFRQETIVLIRKRQINKELVAFLFAASSMPHKVTLKKKLVKGGRGEGGWSRVGGMGKSSI